MGNGAKEKEAKRKARNAERMRKWRAANPPSPELRAKEAERVRQWRLMNPEKYKACLKIWYTNKKERMNRKLSLERDLDEG